ncbi:hypothetical protein [Clostridium tarantellae]|uniref:Uncharacterized protein n=1 Tax=Clostridium tarantellae TaxID=39493 RepID=A0A6I1MM15_9CLOT|nr:hypothetical protein [Clostridium tarantellae]MPQ43157.1 hypothetical protein [Clostridium tarantellae]
MSTLNNMSLLTRANEVGFLEFTAKLINDVFDAIVTSSLNQAQAYMDLISGTKKSLSAFINDTKDSIGGDLILQFLVGIVPNPNYAAGTKISSDSSELLTPTEAKIINNAILIPGLNTPSPANSNTPIKDIYPAIIDAVSKRIAANKYSLFQELSKVGALKILIQEGEIESRVTFNTYESNFYTSNTSQYNSNDFLFSHTAKTGSIVNNWINSSFYTKHSNINVNPANLLNSHSTVTSSQMFGAVKLKFTTTYESLQQ